MRRKRRLQEPETFELAQDREDWELDRLKSECERVFQVANEKVHWLEVHGVPSPAWESVRINGKFYTKGLSREKLLTEYARAIEFINDPTSELIGAIRYNIAHGINWETKSEGRARFR